VAVYEIWYKKRYLVTKLILNAEFATDTNILQ
jgi:hypothetical protein